MSGLIPAKEEKDNTQLSAKHIEHLYIFTLMWSVGAFLELDDRAKMEEFLRTHEDIVLDLPKIPAEADATMFDYTVDTDGEKLFIHNNSGDSDI